MMIDDEFDDIFRMMDRIFGDSSILDRSPIHDRKYERLIDEENIYYTFELPDMHKDNIDIKTEDNSIIVRLFKNNREYTHRMNLPYPILKDKTKVTFINGILDITVAINKDKVDKIDIEG